MMDTALVPSVYIGNIDYYATLIKHQHIVFEQHEYFEKQSFRSRCCIYGANGLLSLFVPTKKIKGQRRIMKDVKIEYAENWQKLHRKSFESAYRSSPYFEYYEHDFIPLLEQKHDFLLDLNDAFHQFICSKLQLDISSKASEAYIQHPENMADYRSTIHPKLAPVNPNVTQKEYPQVFDTKYGFIPNLSVLDLLFNEGPNAAALLQE